MLRHGDPDRLLAIAGFCIFCIGYPAQSDISAGGNDKRRNADQNPFTCWGHKVCIFMMKCIGDIDGSIADASHESTQPCDAAGADIVRATASEQLIKMISDPTAPFRFWRATLLYFTLEWVVRCQATGRPAGIEFLVATVPMRK